MDDHRREALLKEYAEVSNNFRLLTDIRFKLLALLPIAAAAAAAFKGDGTSATSFTLSLFGLVATVGLVTYNARNDQLYDELIGRAASIERSLGLPDGAFANRPGAWLTIQILGLKWPVNHGRGVNSIYIASSALWLLGLLVPTLDFLRRGYLRLGFSHFLVSDPSAWVQVIALILAVLITASVVNSISGQRKRRKKDMTDAAACAVKRALTVDLAEAAHDIELMKLCARLSGEEDEDAVRARANFYAAIDQDSLCHYLPRDSRELRAAQLVGLLTHLPAGWLFERYSNTVTSLQRPDRPAA